MQSSTFISPKTSEGWKELKELLPNCSLNLVLKAGVVSE
jgi:hypothetical protein